MGTTRKTQMYHLIATTIETEIKRLNDDNSADACACATTVSMHAAQCVYMDLPTTPYNCGHHGLGFQIICFAFT